jgi:hypothetical protein
MALIGVASRVSTQVRRKTGGHKIALVNLGPESGLFRPAGHQQIADEHLHGLVPLIERRRAHLDEPLSRARLRYPYLEHFALHTQLIAGPHRSRPTNLIKPEANDAACGFELTLDEQPHRQCRSVPTARRESAEERGARGVLIEVKWLRIELGRKRFDSLRLNLQASGAECLCDCKILKVSFGHRVISFEGRGFWPDWDMKERHQV